MTPPMRTSYLEAPLFLNGSSRIMMWSGGGGGADITMRSAKVTRKFRANNGGSVSLG